MRFRWASRTIGFVRTAISESEFGPSVFPRGILPVFDASLAVKKTAFTPPLAEVSVQTFFGSARFWSSYSYGIWLWV
jgi:hypothetical protein